jgi:post-segregation antitoxin (ccd killing protein)
MANELPSHISQRAACTSIPIEIAPGELIDKITILEIKRERIADSAKLANVRKELDLLNAARQRAIHPSPRLDELTAELKKTNEALWQIEDALRVCERNQEFGPAFIELARSVYRENDRRADLKRQINRLLGSKLIEEKSYATNQTATRINR